MSNPKILLDFSLINLISSLYSFLNLVFSIGLEVLDAIRFSSLEISNLFLSFFKSSSPYP